MIANFEKRGRVLIVGFDGQFLKAMELALDDQCYCTATGIPTEKVEDLANPISVDLLVVTFGSENDKTLIALVNRRYR